MELTIKSVNIINIVEYDTLYLPYFSKANNLNS